MPFCPKCRAEYRASFSQCSDCDEQLVAFLPPEETEEDIYEQEPTYDDWIQLARLTSSQYATMIIEVLHSKNIPAVIKSGAGYFGKLGQMGTSSFRPIDGAYSVMVPREFVVDADREGEIILGDTWRNCRLVNISEIQGHIYLKNILRNPNTANILTSVCK